MIAQFQPQPLQTACTVLVRGQHGSCGHARVGSLSGLGADLLGEAGGGIDRDEIAVFADRRHLQAVLFAALALFGQRRAALGVGIENHAIEAMQALAVVNAAIGINGLRTAAHGASLAAVAVLLALEAKPAEGAGHGQRSAQRADVFAVRPLDEDRQAQDGGHEQAIGPGAVLDAHQEGGFERLDLGELFGQTHRKHRHGDEAEEDDVFEPLEAVMPLLRQLRLKALETHFARHFVDGLGERAERAHPAAKQPAPEQEHRDDDEDPEQEDEWVRQEQRPRPLEQQRMEPGQHLGDGRLRHGTKADEHDAQAPCGVLEGIDRPFILVRGQAREFFAVGIDHRDSDQKHCKQCDLDGTRLPDAYPRCVGLDHLRASAFKRFGWQPVGAVKAGEAAGSRGAVYPVAQEAQLPGVSGRKGG